MSVHCIFSEVLATQWFPFDEDDDEMPCHLTGMVNGSTHQSFIILRCFIFYVSTQ